MKKTFYDKKVTLLDRLIYLLTYRMWNRLISHVLCEHYGLGGGARLTSEQLHALAAEFDPSQNPDPWHMTLLMRSRKCQARQAIEERET